MAALPYRDIFHQALEQEGERIRFLEHERGVEGAVAFARSTGHAYRRAVVSHSPPAGDAIFRLRLMASYCYFKRYLAGRTPGNSD